MPFGNEALNVVFEDFVRLVVEEERGIACDRGADVFGSDVVIDDIRASIDRADMIPADLTGKNANVFYEVGIAHTIGKPVLLLAQSIDDVPFDLRHRRVAPAENIARLLDGGVAPDGRPFLVLEYVRRARGMRPPAVEPELERRVRRRHAVP
jgi:hypothetical protein